ncbi:hypothetical protein KEM52_001093, partial [Ascosphaera acerosa]
FSHVGPSEDRTNTTIVVEHIPDEKCNEEAVREFFSQFGTITEVTLTLQRRLALVKYDTYASARRAWESPKVIFDNRFVKVYWYRPPPPDRDTPMSGADDAAPATPPIDIEQIQKQQAEAQRLYEEKLAKREEMEKARLELEKQKEELLRRQAEERARLLEKIKAKEAASKKAASATNSEGSVAASPAISNGNGAGNGSVNASAGGSGQTQALRAQLALLEAEAKSLGIDPNQEQPSFRGRGSYRAGYRGRGSPRGRGGYDTAATAFRGGIGGVRGRGASRARGTVLRLDNRPKRVAISGVALTPEKEEALRFFLMGVGEYDGIQRNPARADSVIISFKERYVAEQLYYGLSDIPNFGAVEFSWVAGSNPAAATSQASSESTGASASASASAGVHAHANAVADEVAKDSNHALATLAPEAGKEHASHEVDYDVAEDDVWMD